MRPTRTATATLVALLLVAALATPASAGQHVRYAGEQSTGERVRASVLQRDGGRWYLQRLGFSSVDIVCEEGQTETFGIGFGFGTRRTPGYRVDGGRALDKEYRSGFFEDVSFLYARLTGTFRWLRANGTMVFSLGALTDDGGDSQICTSGEITWTAERAGSRPARLTAASMPEGVGFIRLRLNGRGELEVAEFVEP